MASVTAYDHQPPFETKSVTKNHPTTAEMAPMNGNRQMRRSIKAATRIRNSSERCANDQPWNAEFQSLSQPNQCQADPTKKPQAITAVKAKIPAATHVPARRNASAITHSTTRMSSAQAVRAPPPWYSM